MGLVEWSAIGALIAALVPMGTVLWRLADRLNKAEANASAAALTSAGARLDTERLRAELVDHRVFVAQEYVSKETLTSMETRVVGAIDKLAERVDRLVVGNRGG